MRWVRYPFLASHPQYDLAKRQMSGGGTVVTFELDVPDSAAKQRAFEVLDKLQLINISNNLGDSKSLVTHPATTTHRAMGPEGRAAIGLGDGVVRISVGLEGTEDLIADLDQVLELGVCREFPDLRHRSSAAVQFSPVCFNSGGL